MKVYFVTCVGAGRGVVVMDKVLAVLNGKADVLNAASFFHVYNNGTIGERVSEWKIEEMLDMEMSQFTELYRLIVRYNDVSIHECRDIKLQLTIQMSTIPAALGALVRYL